MDTVQLATRIKELCKSQGCSISSMLTECGIRKSLIYDLEKRNTKPSAGVLTVISAYFDVSIEYLLGEEDKFGLTKKDWDILAKKAKKFRELAKLSIEQAYEEAKLRNLISEYEGGISVEIIRNFETNGTPISPMYFCSLCGAIGIDYFKAFYPQSRKLFDLASEPISHLPKSVNPYSDYQDSADKYDDEQNSDYSVEDIGDATIGKCDQKQTSPLAEARELSDSERELIELVKSLNEDEVKEISRYIDYIISKRVTED